MGSEKAAAEGDIKMNKISCEVLSARLGFQEARLTILLVTGTESLKLIDCSFSHTSQLHSPGNPVFSFSPTPRTALRTTADPATALLRTHQYFQLHSE